MRTQTGIFLLVVLLVICMLAAVKFYDNPFVKRYKVNNICFKRLLPAKLDAFKLSVSQIPPEQALCFSAVVTQFSGKCINPPPPTPLPQGAGELS